MKANKIFIHFSSFVEALEKDLGGKLIYKMKNKAISTELFYEKCMKHI